MDEFYKELNMAMYGEELREIGADFHDIIDKSVIEDIISEVVNIEWKEEYLNNDININKHVSDNDKLIKDTERFAKITNNLLKPINNDKCMARVWNEGYGCQCTCSRIDGSMYCKTHDLDVEENGKYSQFGDIDYPYFKNHYNRSDKPEIKWRIGVFPLNMGPKKKEKNKIIMNNIKLVKVEEYKKMEPIDNTLYYILNDS